LSKYPILGRLGIVATGAAVLLLVNAAGVFVGWHVLGHGTFASDTLDVVIAGATIATAIGTISLAIGTFWLAVQTKSAVDVSREEAEAARTDLAVAQNQAETAEAALAAQTQPFMTVGDTSGAFLGSDFVHIRNAGNGPGVISQVLFVAADGTEFSGFASDPAVPPGEGTSLRISRATSALVAKPLHEAPTYSVLATYTDVSGAPRGAVRLDIHRTTVDEGTIYVNTRDRVRQVFWADDLNRDDPTLCTQPND
jgi:hypothetical protein